MNVNFINIPTIAEDTNFWMVRAKRGFFFDEFVNQGFIAIGWNSITQSMLGTSLSKERADALKESIKEDYGENRPGTSLNKCIHFCNHMKNGDIAVIVDNGRIAFAYVEDYYEDNSPQFTVAFEKEIHSQIEDASPTRDSFTCPYIKRRHIQVIKVIGENDTISPYLQNAIARNWHSLSDLNEYAEIVLSGCFDSYIYNDKLTLAFRVKQDDDINTLDLATFVLFSGKLLSNNRPEQIKVKTTLHSPGDILLQIANTVQGWGTTEWGIALVATYVLLFGGKIRDYELPSLLCLVKKFINREYDKEIKELNRRKLRAETELLEEQVESQKIANAEARKQALLSAVDEYSTSLPVASKNLKVVPDEQTIIDLTAILDSLQGDDVE